MVQTLYQECRCPIGRPPDFHSLNPFNPESTLLGHPLEFQAEMNLLLANLGGVLQVHRPETDTLTCEACQTTTSDPVVGLTWAIAAKQ